MRTDQLMGLTLKAQDIVEGETQEILYKGTKTYPNGRTEPFEEMRKESTVKQRTYMVLDGAYQDEFLHLQEYTLPDGRVIREYVQAEPWSSGPCYFLALELHTYDDEWQVMPESLWPEDEIDESR